MARYKVVDRRNHHALYAVGYCKAKLQKDIDSGYFHQYLMPELKTVRLIIIDEHGNIQNPNK